MQKVQVNIHELVPAFHNGSRNARFFLDRKTGQILLDFDNLMLDDMGDDMRHLLASDPARFVEIESIGSQDTMRMMRKFAEVDPHPEACRAMVVALDSTRPFQNFRNVVGAYAAVAERWYEFEQKWVENLARQWLRDHHVDCELVIPVPGQETDGSEKAEPAVE
ncbi:MAG TPA: UPF0158 family protein [Fimbriimonadaceae bacterium]|jgi:hypothetical protein